MSEKNRPKPVVLIILDGWGIAPPSQGNAVTLARTPFFDNLIRKYTHLTIQASGENVGLPWGVMGNSEVGHTNIGAGKVIFQSLPRINHAINDGSFFKNKILLDAIAHTQKNNSQLHLMGIISRGDVHGSIDHLFALLDLIKQQGITKQVFIHGFLDGRDMTKDSGIDFVKEIVHRTKKLKFGQIATLSGRFYAMDRDNHWERIAKVYQAIVKGETTSLFDNPVKAVQTSYQQKVFDEEFLPVVITKHNQPVGKVNNNDAIIFFNYRADRARELTNAFILPDFDKFNRCQLTNLYFATMTQYEANSPVKVIFPKETIAQPLARVISEAGLRQLHISETQKYAHVTYFFNGGKEEAFSREDDILIPSPRVASFAETPKMSAPLVCQRLIKEIFQNKYDFIVVNFANPDMIGHTGKLPAAIKALECVDKLLAKVIESILSKDGVAIIIADHGNVEEMINLQTGEIVKEHTTNPVPFIVVGKQWEQEKMNNSLAQTSSSTGSLGQDSDVVKSNSGTGVAELSKVPKSDEQKSIDLSLVPSVGILADVAPTILKLMNLKQPSGMNGKSLI